MSAADASGVFSRAYSVIKSMVDDRALVADLNVEFEVLENAHKVLVEKHTAYMNIATTQEAKREGDFLTVPNRQLGVMKSKVGKMRAAEAKESEKEKREAEKTADVNTGKKGDDAKVSTDGAAALQAAQDNQKQKDRDEATRLNAALEFEYDLFNDLCDDLTELRVNTYDPAVVKEELDKLTAEKDSLRERMMKIVHLDPTSSSVNTE